MWTICKKQKGFATLLATMGNMDVELRIVLFHYLKEWAELFIFWMIWRKFWTIPIKISKKPLFLASMFQVKAPKYQATKINDTTNIWSSKHCYHQYIIFIIPISITHSFYNKVISSTSSPTWFQTPGFKHLGSNTCFNHLLSNTWFHGKITPKQATQINPTTNKNRQNSD